MDNFDNIYTIAKQLSYLYELKYELIKPRIDYVIENNITDCRVIEHLLDDLLDIPTDKGYSLLKKICDYWKKFNKDSSNFYLDEYKRLYLTK